MATELNHDYRFLDDEEERLALVEDIKQVRHDVLKLADLVPKDKHYEPRYHGWSLAAMLGHLQLMDNLQMWAIELGILGIRVPISTPLLNAFNDRMAEVYRRRLVETTVRGIQKKEKAIAEFVMHVPVDKFSKLVHDPVQQTYLTVEQSLQESFFYHWREHLETMRKVDDMHYEPPTGSTLI